MLHCPRLPPPTPRVPVLQFLGVVDGRAAWGEVEDIVEEEEEDDGDLDGDTRETTEEIPIDELTELPKCLTCGAEFDVNWSNDLGKFVLLKGHRHEKGGFVHVAGACVEAKAPA